MKKTILIVDDEDGVRKEIRLLLSDEGYDVMDAVDGKTALKKMSESNFDVLITDILMPNVDGIELVMRVSEQYPRTHIIAISGGGRSTVHTGQLDYLEMVKRLASVKAVLQKPFTGDTLVETVQQLLEK